MRTLLMLVFALLMAAPAFAQEAETPAEKPKEDKPVEEKADEEKAEEKPEEEERQREMSAEAKKLFADVERVYKKYYEIVLAKFKDNEQYKTDDVWNEAVKEAKNGEYKDGTEFHDAITKMKRADRVFKKKVQDLTTKSAKENAEAIEKWSKEQKNK